MLLASTDWPGFCSLARTVGYSAEHHCPMVKAGDINKTELLGSPGPIQLVQLIMTNSPETHRQGHGKAVEN